MAALFDGVGERVIPDSYEKVVYKKIYDPHGNIVKIYDTDTRVLIGRVKDDYSVDTDLEDMSKIIHHIKDLNKRNAAFIDHLYKIDGIHKYWRVDQDF